MDVMLTAVFVPTGQYYGVVVDEATLTITDILNTTVGTFSLSEETVSSGVSFKGVYYYKTFDTDNIAGPYVTATWVPSSTTYDVTTISSRVPLIPNNMSICVEFEDDLLSVSGDIMIADGYTACYASSFSPFYIPIDYFKENTYGIFDDMTDLEIAYRIWGASKEAQSQTFCTEDVNDIYYPYLQFARQQYAMLKPLVRSLQTMLISQGDMTKRLADIEIRLSIGSSRSSIDALKDWLNQLKELRKVINSCGKVSAGASLRPLAGRIADDYDRSVFGRYVGGKLGDVEYYVYPPSRNHLFTDPFSSYWLY